MGECGGKVKLRLRYPFRQPVSDVTKRRIMPA
jgi:hypothetical protein